MTNSTAEVYLMKRKRDMPFKLSEPGFPCLGEEMPGPKQDSVKEEEEAMSGGQ